MLPRVLVACFLASLAVPSLADAQDKKRPKLPNIIWITSEDHGPHLSCYGDKFARTPNLDKLAKKGMIFTRAWSNAPVCAPARTTIISGLYPPSTGSEHMRSQTRLPADMHLFPYYLRQLGYYCTNKVKEDYNLEKGKGVWDDSSNKAHYKNRKAGQPFFAVFNSTKSHESQMRNPKIKLVSDPAKVRIPAYHPDTPETREDWTRYYDVIALVDADAGDVLRELAEADLLEPGLLENTIIIYFADHGSGLPRNKRTPLNSGLHVPMIVHIPESWKHLRPHGYSEGGKADQLVSFVDLAPTMLSIAGMEPPAWMQGRAFAGKHLAKANEFLHGFRGRMDERYDFQRSVTDGRHVYLRNFMPHLPAGQHVEYMFQTKTTAVWKKQFDMGKLNEAQSAFWRSPRPAEELYDLQSDPDEVKNLAGSKVHQAILEKLRKAQRDHALAIRDVGYLPEDEIHRRSTGSTPYATGHDKKYALEKIIAMADVAASAQPGRLGELRAGLKSDDSAVRYWAVQGFINRGKQGGVLAVAEELPLLLKDESPSVRVAAAEAMARFGSPQDNNAPMKLLIAHADAKKNSLYVSLAALNAIDRVDNKKVVQPYAKAILALPTEPADAKHRGSPGISRLLASIRAKIEK